MACVGDMAGLSLDDALFAATEGDVAMADRALELAAAEGATPVGIIRASLMHLQRLHRVRLSMDDGRSAADAAKACSAADILPPGRCVHPRVGTLVVREPDGGDGWAGGSGTRL